MPFKRQAQRRKFAELLVKGDISNETFEEWNRETGGKTAGAREEEISALLGFRRLRHDDEIARVPGERRFTSAIARAPVLRDVRRPAPPIVLPLVPHHLDGQLFRFFFEFLEPVPSAATDD